MVLAGGAGTRFWPASRRAVPKPFVPLVGRRTLIGDTLERLRLLAPAPRTTVVSAEALGAATRRALRAYPGTRLLLEPVARNTAAAIAWAAAEALGRGDSGVIGVFPADHYIPDARAFARAVRVGAAAAADGERVVLLGIEPARPDTGYGYLRLTRGARGAVVPVARFVEKPDAARARRFVADGGYLWNAGMVLARPERILAETKRLSPEVWDALGPTLERIAGGARVARAALARAYRAVRPLSFDYAVLERSRRVFALRGRFAWSDLGSWDALGTHLPVLEGNQVHAAAPPVLLDAQHNVVWSSTDKTVALLGVRDLLVIQTTDALLVCANHRAQDVRKVVDELARRGRDDLL
ncbi:MAG TPA: sugar phosphate nucleotidyltransferase [Myxococcota bacterium]|nr:sugar phosphate nucleotidyltransferase [Myxococcota bacterium]